MVEASKKGYRCFSEFPGMQEKLTLLHFSEAWSSFKYTSHCCDGWWGE